MSVDEYHPTNRQGSKEERVGAILHPRYENLQIWHYKGGNTQILEEELTSENPLHDDVKDALASAIDVSVPPAPMTQTYMDTTLDYNPRFGGFGG
jgi:hypothetical protein